VIFKFEIGNIFFFNLIIVLKSGNTKNVLIKLKEEEERDDDERWGWGGCSEDIPEEWEALYITQDSHTAPTTISQSQSAQAHAFTTARQDASAK